MASKRRIQDTLKLLVTDGCNLSCTYCVPELQTKKSAKRRGLKHTELLRLVRPLIEQGVTNIDFRGGEPLTKKWLYPFLEELIRMPQIKRISLLTNGVVLKDHAADLQQLGRQGDRDPCGFPGFREIHEDHPGGSPVQGVRRTAGSGAGRDRKDQGLRHDPPRAESQGDHRFCSPHQGERLRGRLSGVFPVRCESGRRQVTHRSALPPCQDPGGDRQLPEAPARRRGRDPGRASTGSKTARE